MLMRFLSAPPSFTSDPKCLHRLVSWAHHHGEACRSCPDLKEVLEGQCWGSVKAVWSCVDGHRYIMDARCSGDTATVNVGGGGGGGDGTMSEEEEQEREEEEDEEEQQQSGRNGRSSAGSMSTLVQSSPAAVTAQTESSALDDWTGGAEGEHGRSGLHATVDQDATDGFINLVTCSVGTCCLNKKRIYRSTRKIFTFDKKKKEKAT